MNHQLKNMKEFLGIDWLDYLVISAYFVIIGFTGIYSSYRSSRDSVGGYFLASRKIHFIPVGASIFASNIGSGHFIGLAGSAAKSGIGVNAFELGATFFILLLGWFFLPVYLGSGVYTMPEYLQKRFGGQRIKMYISILTLILYVFTKISADLYAGALFITVATKTEEKGDLSLYISILILLAFACIFTIFGGLTAVIWTDFIQTILMIVGALILSILSIYEVGGYESLLVKFFSSNPSNLLPKDPNDLSKGYCGEIEEDALHLFRSSIPGRSDLPWTGVVFGLSISAIWYWCSDQVIVQRALAAKNFSHAKGGCIIASYLKLLPLWFIILPGMASRVLFKDVIACSTPSKCKELCNSELGCSNQAFILLVTHLLPEGIRGLMIAVMLAALMSSLTSIFNSASTIFTMDIYRYIRNKSSENELVIVGRIFVFILVIISILWIPVIQSANDSQLFIYIQSITSFLSPPICAVYLLALFWTPTNEPGAFWGLLIGLAIGLIRFGLEFGYSEPACGDVNSPRPPSWWYLLIKDLHFLNFSILLWCLSGLITITISLITPSIPKNKLFGLTYWSRKQIYIGKENHEIFDKKCNRTASDGTPIVNSLETMEVLEETPIWNVICEYNAYLILGISSFFVGFYA
ncbi:sodium/mannose cotransporter SLC5A10 isoform X2 [Lepeophtheirus salmonis]|uniref:sodium/mannose cotransporter SLC5A10 isoform X2 n=1 Tax=Lepeophtheirus salmonis TaxID=72036 RepID=UPI001AE4B298|nr:sodium/glucose cotransporter 5-like isoform X2 [Lepeophtheirus salmonis]